jgi:hypothetical protein
MTDKYHYNRLYEAHTKIIINKYQAGIQQGVPQPSKIIIIKIFTHGAPKMIEER